MTVLLLTIILYEFALIFFFYLSDTIHNYDINKYDSDFPGENWCQDVWQCFISMFFWVSLQERDMSAGNAVRRRNWGGLTANSIRRARKILHADGIRGN